MSEEKALLEVRNLKKYFPIRSGLLSKVVANVRAVDDVSFSVPRGKTVSLVGESGCGKTTTGRTALRLLEKTAGDVTFDGQDVFGLDNSEMRKLRKRMQIVFQDPFSSLNPRMTVGDIIGEGIYLHGTAPKAEIRDRVAELLEKVELSPEFARRYPHEFSGGQRQRVGIARALSTNPDFILCDEAVSALDVSIQAQIINLLMQLQQEMGLTYLFIAHDLAVVRHLSHRVIVMYLGQIVEEADTQEIFDNPLHPYTKALLSSVPIPDPRKRDEYQPLTGEVPSPVNPPSGCRFHPRCPFAKDECKHGEIPEYQPSSGHRVKCILCK